MTNHITIRKAEGKWVVRAGGAVLGESTDALELTEGNMAPVIYFPRADIAMAFLDPSDTITSSPEKGQATHFSIETKSTTLKDAAWSYESPEPEAARIKDHLAFHASDTVTVERL
ncbi:MAG: DUF427 domain-containing protein [Paracoccaceae bacterium]